MNSFNLLFILIVLSTCNAQQNSTHENVIANSENWIVEQQPGGKVVFNTHAMKIIDAKGCTVWYKKKLEGNIKIEYDITIIDKDGPYDRVSDMNCFWMANDPDNPDDFFKESKQRAGHFPNYHNLKLYYVGYGGHNNTKTRFRRYNGDIERPLLPDHDLSGKEYMIMANKKMHIEISVKDNYTTYRRDGNVIFEVYDSEPYSKGYFGFRTITNHLEIENFNISELEVSEK